MKIEAPNKQYSGVSASVTFVNGIGETDNPYLLDWFRSHGYVTEENVDTTTMIPEEVEKLKKDELKQLAKKLGIEYSSSLTNEQLVALIKEHKPESGE